MKVVFSFVNNKSATDDEEDANILWKKMEDADYTLQNESAEFMDK